MTALPESYELLIEEGGIVTLPDAVIRHLGCEPGLEVQLDCDVRPDGSIVILPVAMSEAQNDGA